MFCLFDGWGFTDFFSSDVDGDFGRLLFRLVLRLYVTVMVFPVACLVADRFVGRSVIVMILVLVMSCQGLVGF